MRSELRPPLPVAGIRLQLWRAVSAYRVLTLLVTLYLIARWQHLYARPGVADAVGAGMLAVTAGMTWLALSGRAHRPAIVAADAIVTALLTIATIPAQTATQRHGSMPTLTTFWAAGPALEAGIVAFTLGGVVAALVQIAAAMVVRAGYDGRTLGSFVLLVVAGGTAGYVTALAVRAERDLAAATAAAAATRERDRLARSVHDGVLQVLALVHREGRGAGGRWDELARLAAEQEASLRALITTAGEASIGGARDVAAALQAVARDVAVPGGVTISAPSHRVVLPTHTVDELAAAVRAALDNVARHAGGTAAAWVLVEQRADAVCVTVRDNGVGFAADRLAVAERSGRLGIAGSIRGRIADLGGAVVITADPGGGTCVELTVPRSRQ